MNREVFATIIALLVSILFVVVAPALAKNLNLPEGANRIGYFYGGEEVVIDLPTPLPSNYPISATKMGFSFSHVKIPNAEIEFNRITVQFYMSTPSIPELHWVPFAHLIDSYPDVAFLKTLYSGTLVEFDASLYNLPELFNLDNVIVVPENILQVERRGNNIYVSLKAPQQIDNNIISPPIFVPNAYFTLYPFSLELNGYGDSVHKTTTISFVGYPGASGYTLLEAKIGFNANGIFTSLGLIPGTVTVNDAFIIMQGTHEFYPPA